MDLGSMDPTLDHANGPLISTYSMDPLSVVAVIVIVVFCGKKIGGPKGGSMFCPLQIS